MVHSFFIWNLTSQSPNSIRFCKCFNIVTRKVQMVPGVNMMISIAFQIIENIFTNFFTIKKFSLNDSIENYNKKGHSL